MLVSNVRLGGVIVTSPASSAQGSPELITFSRHCLFHSTSTISW